MAEKLSLSSYRRLKCQSVAVDGSGSKPSGAKLKHLEWSDLGVRGSRLMGDESTIAQVHPKERRGLEGSGRLRPRLCDAMWSYSRERGSSFRQGVVQELVYADSEEGRRVERVRVDGTELEADKVVLCMGPWGEVLQQAVPAARWP